MTDEQWLWLFVNEAIDYDEKLEHMCDKCQSDATSNRCIRCGKPLGDSGGFKPQFVNPNFDAERFDRLYNGTDEESEIRDEDIDYDLVDRILTES